MGTIYLNRPALSRARASYALQGILILVVLLCCVMPSGAISDIDCSEHTDLIRQHCQALIVINQAIEEARKAARIQAIQILSGNKEAINLSNDQEKWVTDFIQNNMRFYLPAETRALYKTSRQKQYEFALKQLSFLAQCHEYPPAIRSVIKLHRNLRSLPVVGYYFVRRAEMLGHGSQALQTMKQDFTRFLNQFDPFYLARLRADFDAGNVIEARRTAHINFHLCHNPPVPETSLVLPK